MPTFGKAKSCDDITFRSGKFTGQRCSIVTIMTSDGREDYQAYNRLCGSIRSLLHRLEQLPSQDPFRSKYQNLTLAKLYDMAVVDTGAKIENLSEKITVSSFCRRRLAVVLCKLKMSQTVKMVRSAVTNQQTLTLTSGYTIH